MKYISTRGNMNPSGFSNILIKSTPPNGGLTVPENLPHYSMKELESMRDYSYQDLAVKIMGDFADDIPKEDLGKIVNNTYTEKIFNCSSITPVHEILPSFFLLDLSNGPSKAFKDIAMQLLINLFEYKLDKTKDFLNITGASSGDTVAAAEYAVKGKKNMSIFMLTPYQRMSPFQTAHVFCLDEPNIFNIAIRNGVFDDCQSIKTTADKDREFYEKYHIGTVNSINWARVAAQVVYYFKAYANSTNRTGEIVDFCVPTGNFGDIFAGYTAKMMGLPIRKLVLATNENKVLDEFFKTGIYKPRNTKEVIETDCPSIDISKAANFERFLFDIFGRDPNLTRRYMETIEKRNLLDLTDTNYFNKVKNSCIVSGSANHDERIETIKEIYSKTNIIIDPHTANAISVAFQYRERGIPMICLETAKPIKFEETIKEALGFIPERPEELKDLEKKPQKYGKIEKGDVELFKKYVAKNAITRHN